MKVLNFQSFTSVTIANWLGSKSCDVTIAMIWPMNILDSRASRESHLTDHVITVPLTHVT